MNKIHVIKTRFCPHVKIWFSGSLTNMLIANYIQYSLCLAESTKIVTIELHVDFVRKLQHLS